MKNHYLVNFSLYKVRKSELPKLTVAIMDVVETYNPEKLKIAGMYNMLTELRPQMDILSQHFDGAPHTQEYHEQRKLRNQTLGALASQLDANHKFADTSKATQEALVLPFLKKYMKGICSKNNEAKSSKVISMLNDLAGNEEMNQAVNELGLSKYIDLLRTSQQHVNEGDNKRTNTLSVRPKYNNKNARERVIFAIENLFKAIELAKVENTELDYMPLINELNVLIANRLSVIKSRNTRAKNSDSTKKATVAMSANTSATAI